MTDLKLLRTCAAAGVLAGLLNLVGNGLHPSTLPSDTGEERLREIAENTLWLPTHAMIVVGLLASLFAFHGLDALLANGPGRSLSGLAMRWATVAVAVGLVLIALDGFAVQRIAEGWLQSPGAERATSFRVAAAVEELELTIFSVFLVVYFGLTFGLFAAAAAQSGQVRRWPASIATVTGVAAIGIGLYQLYFGLSNVTVVLFVTVWSIQPLWLIMVSIELWRAARSGRTERPSDAPG